MNAGSSGKSKQWIKEFLFIRELFDGPDGSPLYQYQVTNEEYSDFPSILRQSIADLGSPVYKQYWSAIFCMYVAEKYRREYDGSNLGWSWKGFEKPLSIKFPPNRHSEIVAIGLVFWKRTLRTRAHGNDYLGSLFDEGGLPWRLIQSDSHGFGRAVRGALTNYYRVKQFGGDIASTIANYEHYFPQTFRTQEKYLLMASVVEWLMTLAEKYPIAEVSDPADYLDQHATGWQAGSPLPLGEENARRLINEWLIDAGKTREEKKRLEADEKNYTCDHRLNGPYTAWSLQTDVYLPAEILIEPENQTINSTRLELAFFEGDTLLSRHGIVHGKVSEDRSRMTVKINRRVVSVQRSQPELPLTVQFLSNGECLHACYFEGSEVDYATLPLIFIRDEADSLSLLSTVSTVIPADHALVRLPQCVNPQDDVDVHTVAEDLSGGRWIEVTKDLVLIAQESRIVLTFGSEQGVTKPTLIGNVALYSSLPNLVYRGWPRVAFNTQESRQYRLVANGVPVANEHDTNTVGAFSLNVEGGEGETLLRRKIGVIPRDLRVQSVPASSSNRAKVILKSMQALKASVENSELDGEVQKTSEGLVVMMEPRQGQKAPEGVKIALTDAKRAADPVVLRIPFPKVGVHLFNDGETEFKGSSISIDQMIQMSMSLTPKPGSREQFFISLELMGQNLPNFRRHYPVMAEGKTKRISLFAFHEDIQQMLGTNADQDAYVRVRVETDCILKQIDIVRYNARLDGPDALGRFVIEMEAQDAGEGRTCVQGMRLEDPSATPVDVEERESQGVGMGVFEIPHSMMKNGPWLLYPPSDSTAKFRPHIWVTEDMEEPGEAEAETLHKAAGQFHPFDNPSAFNRVIARMAQDPLHSGWQYLQELKQNFSELPLSAFESWKALAKDEQALALAVFRLSFDPQFCRRMSNELAVIWETVTVQTWLGACQAYRALLFEQGLAESLAESLLQERIMGAASVVPCFQYLAPYLKGPQKENLQVAPYFLAGYWFDDLRRNHADDRRWPELFSDELSRWVQQESLPDEIQNLSNVGFAKAVAYIPVFMAAVTAGKTTFSALTDKPAQLRFAVRVLSDFDREGWYEPVYSLVLSNMLLEQDE